MDFKIGDDILDESSVKEQKTKSKKLAIIIVVVVAIVSGLLVFLVSNAILNKNPKDVTPPSDKKLSLSEENVEILYNYISYGTTGVRNDKFVTERNVTLDSFTNIEKFYYALQFAQADDFVSTGRVDEKGHKIYNISSSKIRSYLQRFFGRAVIYSNDEVIKHTFDFRINGNNVGVLTYSNVEDGFDTVFTEYYDITKENSLIQPFYTELVGAKKKVDGSYELVEKVIYTQLEKVNDTYTVSIYKDPEHSSLLETKPNQTEEMLKSSVISMSDYNDKASTVTYKFLLNGTTLYFGSSNINS